MEKTTTIISFLTNTFPELKGIYLFGSQADDTARQDSDWDIALLFPHTYTPDNQLLWEAKWDLGGILSAPVDLLNLRQIPILTKAEIISSAKRIYSSDDFYCDNYETTIYSMYTKYSEEVADTVTDIKKRGFVSRR